MDIDGIEEAQEAPQKRGFKGFMERVATNKPEDGPLVRKTRMYLMVIGYIALIVWWIYFRG